MVEEENKGRRSFFGVFGRFRKSKSVPSKRNDKVPRSEPPNPWKEDNSEKEPESLKEQIDAIVEEITADISEEALESIQKATQKLVESGIAEKAIKKGDTAPDFSLQDAQGNMVVMGELLKQGPVILTFYRGVWCPYCNLQLKAYQKYLRFFQEIGANLVAVSPHLPKYTAQVVEKNNLEYAALSDVGNVVAKQFGLAYSLDESLRPIYRKWGIDLPLQNGDSSYEIPLVATYVIDTDGNVIYSFVEADFTKRAEPAEVFAALEESKL